MKLNLRKKYQIREFQSKNGESVGKSDLEFTIYKVKMPMSHKLSLSIICTRIQVRVEHLG